MELPTKQQQSDCAMNMPTRSTAYLQSTESNEKFLVKYSPEMKKELSNNRPTAVAEVQSNPTLAAVAAVYGSGVVADWLTIQLTQTFALCGFDFQLGARPTIKIVADKIASEYDYLRLGELALFFNDFEQGAFGDFATRYDNQRFFNSLQQFLQVRAALRERKMQEERERARKEAASRAVPLPDNLPTLQAFLKKRSVDEKAERGKII